MPVKRKPVMSSTNWRHVTHLSWTAELKIRPAAGFKGVAGTVGYDAPSLARSRSFLRTHAHARTQPPGTGPGTSSRRACGRLHSHSLSRAPPSLARSLPPSLPPSPLCCAQGEQASGASSAGVGAARAGGAGDDPQGVHGPLPPEAPLARRPVRE